MTREEKNRKQREYRNKSGNKCTIKYERTPKGYIMRKYQNMKSRISGVQKKKAHLYKGLELLNKESFYQWAFSSKEFDYLWTHYVKSGFDCKLSPSVDRVDSSKGYTLDNMEWVTHSENSRRGAISRHSK